MTIVKKIKMAETYIGITESELARRLGTSASALNQRMKTGKFTSEELDSIAEALGARFVCYLEFPDGTRI